MDIVPNAGAVGRRVVGPENLQRRAIAPDGFKSGRDEVSLRAMNLAHQAVFIGTRRIEIAESDKTNSVGPIVSTQSLLEREFGGAIGIDRQLRRILGYGHLCRRAVGGASRRENKLPDIRLQYRVQQGESGDKVVLKILSGIEDR